MITSTRPDPSRDPLNGIDDEFKNDPRITDNQWSGIQDGRTQSPGEIHPDRFFLILFLRSSSIYRTWIKKDDFTNFREKFQKARTLEATPEDIKKRFFQFGRHDEFDLLDIS